MLSWEPVRSQESIQSREDFVDFLHVLVKYLCENPESWENRDLASYLERLAAWVKVVDRVYRIHGEEIPEQLDWKFIGGLFLAAKTYE